MNEGTLRRNYKFTVVPEHLIRDTSISHRAVRLWMILDRLAAGQEVTFPSRQMLADALDDSRESVDRAVKELCDKGWLTKERAALGDVNAYVLQEAAAPVGVVTGDDTPRHGRRQVSSRVTAGVVTGDEQVEKREVETGDNIRALRRRGAETAPQEMAAGELPDEGEEPVALAPPKRKNAASMAKFFARWATSAYPMAPESSGEAPLARNIRTWLNNGVDITTVEAAMELFFTDDRFHRPGQPLWRSFVHNFTDLANRANGRAGLPKAKPVARKQQKEQEKPMTFAERKAAHLARKRA